MDSELIDRFVADGPIIIPVVIERNSPPATTTPHGYKFKTGSLTRTELNLTNLEQVQCSSRHALSSLVLRVLTPVISLSAIFPPLVEDDFNSDGAIKNSLTTMQPCTINRAQKNSITFGKHSPFVRSSALKRVPQTKAVASRLKRRVPRCIHIIMQMSTCRPV